MHEHGRGVAEPDVAEGDVVEAGHGAIEPHPRQGLLDVVGAEHLQALERTGPFTSAAASFARTSTTEVAHQRSLQHPQPGLHVRRGVAQPVAHGGECLGAAHRQ